MPLQLIFSIWFRYYTSRKYFSSYKWYFTNLAVLIPAPISPAEIQPVFPPQGGEKQPDDPMKFFLDALLEFMVTQVFQTTSYLTW